MLAGVACRPGRVGLISACFLTALLSVVLLSSSARAELKPHYASIVLDAETGRVLSEVNADLPHYPASLTKMMTLYLVFEALEKGRLRLDQSLPVSDYAASQSPTKLGLLPGETITVRDVILGLVTRSANDAAVVAAEGLAGSEESFAQRMTQKARALGMHNTTFRNASGLPDPGQVTTARDIAKLARALYRDFPDKYRYFATEEFVFRGEVITTHNHLMKQFAGMDGIKTGFIRASGFNLAASAVRDNWRLVGVVMGGSSARARDVQMAELLNASFARRSSPPLEVAQAPDAPPSDSFALRAARSLRNLSPVSRAEAAQPATPPTQLRSATNNTNKWSIQVGAFSQRTAAEKAAATALAKLHAAKSKTAAVLAPSQAGKDSYYRARINNFTATEAERACRTLHKQHRDCVLVPPSAVHMASR